MWSLEHHLGCLSVINRSNIGFPERSEPYEGYTLHRSPHLSSEFRPLLEIGTSDLNSTRRSGLETIVANQDKCVENCENL